jgi:hypothetical protein
MKFDAEQQLWLKSDNSEHFTVNWDGKNMYLE